MLGLGEHKEAFRKLFQAYKEYQYPDDFDIDLLGEFLEEFAIPDNDGLFQNFDDWWLGVTDQRVRK